jgi:hypothetical protein
VCPTFIDIANLSGNSQSDSTTFIRSHIGIAERQTSKAFLKSAPMNPEDYKKQSEDIDKESDDNWYKMQSLEDRIVNEGSSAKTGKDVGSYNGQKVSVVSPSQLQLLQTEYPSYPAYLTPLLRTKVNNE